jgi:beta-glucosidase
MNPKNLLLLLLFFLLFSCGAGPKYPFQNTKLDFESRAEDLVSRMTVEEKVGQMTHSATGV